MLDAHQLLWTQIAAGICLLIFGGMLYNLIRVRGQMRAARIWDKVDGCGFGGGSSSFRRFET